LWNWPTTSTPKLSKTLKKPPKMNKNSMIWQLKSTVSGLSQALKPLFPQTGSRKYQMTLLK
jgi:hypothetical protein